MTPETSPFMGLIRLIAQLRGKNGCPWDRKQTPQTLSVYLIEEVYELVEAIQSGNPQAVCEELGDVLFLIFFLAAMYQEQGHFDIRETVIANTRKMRDRHPHVFGKTTVDSAEDVRQQWHQIKAAEKNQSQNASLLDSVPRKIRAHSTLI